MDLKMSKRASEKNMGETKNQKFKKELTIDEKKQKLFMKLLMKSRIF